jgi:hypothetical protein
LLFTACEEDTLREIQPIIMVCAAEDTPDEACNSALDVGELYVGLENARSVWVRNAGDARLGVASLASEPAPLLVADPSEISVGPAAQSEIALTLTTEQLGTATFTLVVESDDPATPRLTIPVSYEGVPAPAPVISLCYDDAGREACGTDIELDFGLVRRTQTESRVIIVRNDGDAPLEIEEVQVTEASSRGGELEVTTSTRAGTLEPGDEAPVVVRYAPLDGSPDKLTLGFASNDPDTPLAVAEVSATSETNAPPVADAEELGTTLTTIETKVGENVVIDGTGSSDPEGDPLTYAWSLTTPDQSAAALDDDTAGRVLFSPDKAGNYRVELLVTDSLGQQSEMPAVVEVQALPQAALRARLSWESGGDLDVHLVPTGDALFSATDCYFENPRPDLGVASEPLDDPELLGDAEASPGVENIVLAEPADGTYEIWVQYFDESGSGEAAARVEVTLFDASFPAFDGTSAMPSTCDAWHVGDVTFPEGTFTASMDAMTSVCP